MNDFKYLHTYECPCLCVCCVKSVYVYEYIHLSLCYLRMIACMVISCHPPPRPLCRVVITFDKTKAYTLALFPRERRMQCPTDKNTQNGSNDGMNNGTNE